MVWKGEVSPGSDGHSLPRLQPCKGDAEGHGSSAPGPQGFYILMKTFGLCHTLPEDDRSKPWEGIVFRGVPSWEQV